MYKHNVSITFNTLSGKAQPELIQALQALVDRFETGSQIIQTSVYTWSDPYSGKPQEFNSDGTVKQKEFDIVNIAKSVL